MTYFTIFIINLCIDTRIYFHIVSILISDDSQLESKHIIYAIHDFQQQKTPTKKTTSIVDSHGRGYFILISIFYLTISYSQFFSNLIFIHPL